jgi:Uri superfamily endonuclease
MKVVPGLDQLRICLKQPRTIRISALGSRILPAGWYVYTGSARNGLAQRVGRHLRREKQKHWRIAYLLAVAVKVEASVLPETQRTECSLHRNLTGGKVVVPGFGSTDCGREAHLGWFGKRPGIRLTPWRQFIRDRRLY